MRTRLLRPGFFESEELAALPPHARLLFEGLWLMADRAGRLRDRPAVIRATVFPYEPAVDVDAHLTELARAGFIARYTGSSGQQCLEVVNFTVHQNPHHREPDTKLPAPHDPAKFRSKNAKPRKSRGLAAAEPRKCRADTDLDPDLDTNTHTNTQAAAEPGLPPPVMTRYLPLAAHALERALLEQHSDDPTLVLEQFIKLCREHGEAYDADLATQAIEITRTARARKAGELFDLMRRSIKRA